QQASDGRLTDTQSRRTCTMDEERAIRADRGERNIPFTAGGKTGTATLRVIPEGEGDSRTQEPRRSENGKK
ncbi:MAG: hypothetical protein WC279_15000, partial [Sulfurimonas sp.]|uniref:hypothetical protein n=1 Tax=Sulfurimonas sp. TaxID=2022749 RepID=UPI00356A75CC